MAMQPKRVKYRKAQRGKIRGKAFRGNRVSFGEFGLQSLDPGWIDGRQIEAGRVAAVRTAPDSRVWIRIFPHKPVTARAAETRMGTGKGEVEFWAAVVKPGTMLYELGGCTEAEARAAFNRVAHKMPVRVRFVRRLEFGE